MTNPAETFTELFRSAAVSFADARGVLESESPGAKPSNDTAEYSAYSLITGLERIALLLRKFQAIPEARSMARGERPDALTVVGDAAFRASAEAAAAQIEASAGQLGVAGPRLAKTIRRWIESGALEEARVLASQCDTAIRITKRRVR